MSQERCCQCLPCQRLQPKNKRLTKDRVGRGRSGRGARDGDRKGTGGGRETYKRDRQKGQYVLVSFERDPQYRLYTNLRDQPSRMKFKKNRKVRKFVPLNMWSASCLPEFVTCKSLERTCRSRASSRFNPTTACSIWDACACDRIRVKGFCSAVSTRTTLRALSYTLKWRLKSIYVQAYPCPMAPPRNISQRTFSHTQTLYW